MASKRLVPIIFAILVTLNLWVPISSVHAQSETPIPALILLTSDNEQRLAQAQALIKAGGGHTRHTLPHQALIAQVSPSDIHSLAALPGVADVFTQAVDPSSVEKYGPNALHIASVWNSLVAPQATPPNVSLMTTGHPDDPDDALTAPDLPPAGGTMLLATSASSSITPGYYQTSEYLAGTVAVGIVLVESDGSGDDSTEDWTSSEKQQVFDEIVAGLNWWAEMEPRAHLNFVYDDHFSNPLPTSVEPISRPYYDQRYWIADAMSELGYDASSYFTQVRDYNNNLRATYQTDWAFTIFVVDSSADGDNRFSDGLLCLRLPGRAIYGDDLRQQWLRNQQYGRRDRSRGRAHLSRAGPILQRQPALHPPRRLPGRREPKQPVRRLHLG